MPRRVRGAASGGYRGSLLGRIVCRPVYGRGRCEPAAQGAHHEASPCRSRAQTSRFLAGLCAGGGMSGTGPDQHAEQRLTAQSAEKRPDRDRLPASAELAAGEQNARQARRNAEQSQTIADLTASNASRYRFGNGEVLAHGPRLYLAMRALPAPPPGKVYQAWTLPKGSKKMAPSLTFRPSPGGLTVIRLPESAERVSAVAVSVEPEGGSKQPTSTPIAVTPL